MNIRELVAAIISLAIAALALWIMYDLYATAKTTLYSLPADQPQLDAYVRRKDILLLALGFFGTVTGYYLGRVPAEKQADAARETARVAENSERKIKEQFRAGLTNIQQQRSAAGGGVADPVDAQVNALLAIL